MWPYSVTWPALVVALLALVRPCLGGEAPLVAQVVAALDSVLKYYEENHHLLDLQGILGAKVIEGQLTLMVAKHNKGLLNDEVDYILSSQLSQMATRAGRVVRLSLPSLYETHPISMLKLRHLLHLSWDVGHPRRRLNLSLVWDQHNSERNHTMQHNLTEYQSQQCMGEVLEPLLGNVCGLSEECVAAMTVPHHGLRALTRQLRYSIVAEMSGCGSRLEQWIVSHKPTSSLEQLQAELCANLYPEGSALPTAIHTHPRPAALWELFLEIEYLCGMLGYSQFLQHNWLQDTLDRQAQSGCFSPPPARTHAHPPDPPPGHTQGHGVGQGHSTTSTVATVAVTLSEEVSEKILKDGCLSRLTGLAASSLAVHLHALLLSSQSLLPAGKAVPPPPPRLLPPPPRARSWASGIVVNKPLYRGDIHSGLNRIADKDISLEDKADQLMQRLEEERIMEKLAKKTKGSKTQEQKTRTDPQITKPFHNLILPDMAVPLTVPQPTSATVPVVPLWLAVVGVAMVMAGVGRYAHSRRRRCALGIKGKFRL